MKRVHTGNDEENSVSTLNRSISLRNTLSETNLRCESLRGCELSGLNADPQSKVDFSVWEIRVNANRENRSYPKTDTAFGIGGLFDCFSESFE